MINNNFMRLEQFSRENMLTNNNPTNNNPTDNNNSTNNNNSTDNNPTDLVVVFGIGFLIIVLYIIMTIIAVNKTKNDTIKLFLIVGIFIPVITPFSFVLTILILLGLVK